MFNWLSRLFGNPDSNATTEVKKPAKKIETVTVTKVDRKNKRAYFRTFCMVKNKIVIDGQAALFVPEK